MFSSSTLGLALLFAPAAFAAVHDIQVGGPSGELVFNPEAIFADAGDQIVFHFNPKNHSVVQSSFASPCGPKDGGVRAPFFPVEANTTSPTWTVTLNDTQPFWAYCPQAKDTAMFHCGKGMVFSANCGADGTPNSFTNFKNAALAIGSQLAASAPVASSTSAGGYGDASAAPSASNTWTAAYGGYTVPPVSDAQVVTQTVTLESSTWETTYSSYPGSPAPTPAALEGTVHVVKVGGPDGLVFTPPSIQAAPRDTIVFEMHSKNHSVTQSTFTDPCRKMADGFDTDLRPKADETGTFETYNITVNATTPLWFYCKQKTADVTQAHCGQGMVFSVNAVGDRSFDAFKSLAMVMNGTAAAAIAAPSGTGTSADAGNSASNVKATAGLSLLLVAAAAVLL